MRKVYLLAVLVVVLLWWLYLLNDNKVDYWSLILNNQKLINSYNYELYLCNLKTNNTGYEKCRNEFKKKIEFSFWTYDVNGTSDDLIVLVFDNNWNREFYLYWTGAGTHKISYSDERGSYDGNIIRVIADNLIQIDPYE